MYILGCRVVMGECMDFVCVHIMLWPGFNLMQIKKLASDTAMRTTVADGKIHVLIKI